MKACVADLGGISEILEYLPNNVKIRIIFLPLNSQRRSRLLTHSLSSYRWLVCWNILHRTKLKEIFQNGAYMSIDPDALIVAIRGSFVVGKVGVRQKGPGRVATPPKAVHLPSSIFPTSYPRL